MNLYFVTWDILRDKKYHSKSARFCAENAKAACAQIKSNYWQRIEALQAKGYSYDKARRLTPYPFHITAKRMP